MLFEKSGNFQGVSIEIGLTPTLPMFVFIHSFRTPLPLHNKTFVKIGLLEEMKGINDNASAFMHPNIKIDNS